MRRRARRSGRRKLGRCIMLVALWGSRGIREPLAKYKEREEGVDPGQKKEVV